MCEIDGEELMKFLIHFGGNAWRKSSSRNMIFVVCCVVQLINMARKRRRRKDYDIQVMLLSSVR